MRCTLDRRLKQWTGNRFLYSLYSLIVPAAGSNSDMGDPLIFHNRLYVCKVKVDKTRYIDQVSDTLHTLLQHFVCFLQSIRHRSTTIYDLKQFIIRDNDQSIDSCFQFFDTIERVAHTGLCLETERRFHCFACQGDGDVIDFTSRLFGLSSKEAALKLAEDFSISFDRKGHDPPQKRVIKRKISEEMRYRQAEQKCFRVLCDYLRLLERWKEEYAPKQPEDDWHPLFVEALHRQPYIEYLLDLLLSDSIEERAFVVAEYGKEVRKIEQRISEFIASHPAGCDERSRSHSAGTER